MEAIERAAFPIADLPYAVEAIERQSVTTFDPLETVFQQRPMPRPSDTIDQQDTSQVSHLQDLSQSRMGISSSPNVDFSPPWVEMPSSPESSPADTSAAPKHSMVSIESTDEELLDSRVDNQDDQSIHHLSSYSSDVSTNFSPEQPFRSVSEDAFEVGLQAGDLFIPMCLSPSMTEPVGDDNYEAYLRATGIFVPRHLSKPESRNDTPSEHSRTISAFSDDTDDSCASTTHNPSCNPPPPFPVSHVRSERALRNPNIIDALATHGDEQVCIAGPANTGINASLPSPFDDLRSDISIDAELKIYSPTPVESVKTPHDYVRAAWPTLNDPQGSSPDTESNLQSPNNSDTPQKTLDAAELPSIVSPSPFASKKARSKQEKSSSEIRPIPLTDNTTAPKGGIFQLDSGPLNRERNKIGPISSPQNLVNESARVAGTSVQKPNPNHLLDGKNGSGRHQTSLEEIIEKDGDCEKYFDSSSTSNLSTESPGGKGGSTATLPVTSSPLRKNFPQANDKASSDEICENVGSATKDSKSRLEPELGIQHSDSTSANPCLHDERKSGSISYAGHEMEIVPQAVDSVVSRHKLNLDFQKDRETKAGHVANGDEAIDNGNETDRDTPRTPSQKRKCKLPSESDKKLKVQKELERKADRARSRLSSKLKSGTPDQDRVREGDSPHKEGRPPWRP